MDPEDDEALASLLRETAREYTGWSLRRFLDERPSERTVVSADRRRYFLDPNVLDRCGEYDPEHEMVEVSVTLTDLETGRLAESEFSLEGEETFSGELESVRVGERTPTNSYLILGFAQQSWLPGASPTTDLPNRPRRRLPQQTGTISCDPLKPL